MSDPAAAPAELRHHCHSAILATTGADGAPDASYAPFVESGENDGAILILVSGLARHTGNLLRTGRASALLIEDEAASGQIFGRRRATYACRVEPVARDSAAWTTGITAMQARHGAVVTMLRDLPDFQLLRLVPESGTLVLGFGKAWRLSGPGCTTLEPIGR
jgi:putative heme iron utilization protein